MGTRIKRAAQLGLLAKDMASARIHRGGPGHASSLKTVVARIGAMHGLPQKIGQLLAFSEIDGSDPLFNKLTESEPQIPAQDPIREFENRTGRRVADVFRFFSPEGIEASISHVHRAQLWDGRRVAVKMQYAGLAENIQTDLRALGWITNAASGIKRGFDLANFRSEMVAALLDELDFRKESQALKSYADLCRGLEEIQLPEPVPELCSETVLTTTWIEGSRIEAARRWPRVDRERIAELLLSHFLRSVFQWNHFHADPNPGNYRFIRNAGEIRVGLLDFGCVRSMQPGFASGLKGLIDDAVDGQNSLHQAEQRFLQMGFDGRRLHALKSRLAQIAALLAEPFTSEGLIQPAKWKLGQRLAEVLGPDRMAFRMAGPPEMIFLLRTFQGLLHYLDLLGVPVCWSSSFERHANPRTADTPLQHGSFEYEDSKTSLCIQILDRGQPTVSLEFAGSAAGNLAGLIPPEIQARLREKCFDLEQISSNARNNHFSPAELFHLEQGTKSVRVWIQ